jgi:hypothetical protein
MEIERGHGGCQWVCQWVTRGRCLCGPGTVWVGETRVVCSVWNYWRYDHIGRQCANAERQRNGGRKRNSGRESRDGDVMMPEYFSGAIFAKKRMCEPPRSVQILMEIESDRHCSRQRRGSAAASAAGSGRQRGKALRLLLCR